MAILIKSIHHVTHGIFTTYLPNSPNKECLPEPVEAHVLSGQYWINNISGMIVIIKSATKRKVLLHTQLSKTKKRTEEIDIKYFLGNYHLIQEPLIKKRTKLIKFPEKIDKLNIL